MLDRIGFWLADRMGIVLTIELIIGAVLIIYGLLSGGFASKGY